MEFLPEKQPELCGPGGSCQAARGGRSSVTSSKVLQGERNVWGEGRERERPPHAHTRTHNGETSSSSHPNADFFLLPSFFFFSFWKNKDFGVGWRCCFSGVAVGGWGGEGWRLEEGAGGLNERKSQISLAELPRSSVRNLEKERRGRKGEGGGGNN